MLRLRRFLNLKLYKLNIRLTVAGFYAAYTLLKYNEPFYGSEDFIIPTSKELLEAKQIIFDVIKKYEEKRH